MASSALQSPNILHTIQKYAPQIHSIFLTPVSGTCVIKIWDRIRLVPASGADYNTVLSQARK